MPKSCFTHSDIEPEAGVRGRVLARAGCEDLYVGVTVDESGSLEKRLESLARSVERREARVAGMKVMGIDGCDGSARRLIEKVFGRVDWPITWLDEGADARPLLAGVDVHAVAGPELLRLRLDGRVVGTCYEDADARYCLMEGILPHGGGQAASEQARSVFEQMAAGLQQADMSFADVVRTWFWNDDILAWYGEFNSVRTEFFREHGIFDGLVPASTGVGAHNAAGAALTGALLALVPKEDSTRTFAVESPLQSSACDYGSSFSRAAEIATPSYRRLLVSGTASIAPSGETVHLGDVTGQVELTMGVVEAILQSRGMAWSDVSRAIAYFPRARDVQTFRAFLGRNSIPQMPFVPACFTLCRDDLLFEIELDALGDPRYTG